MKDIDTEFTDINKENKYKNYIIVGILYLIVIILSVFLILGLKKQKDTVEESIPNEQNTNNVNNNNNNNNLNETNDTDASEEESNNSSFINEFEVMDQFQ